MPLEPHPNSASEQGSVSVDILDRDDVDLLDHLDQLDHLDHLHADPQHLDLDDLYHGADSDNDLFLPEIRSPPRPLGFATDDDTDLDDVDDFDDIEEEDDESLFVRDGDGDDDDDDHLSLNLDLQREFERQTDDEEDGDRPDPDLPYEISSDDDGDAHQPAVSLFYDFQFLSQLRQLPPLDHLHALQRSLHPREPHNVLPPIRLPRQNEGDGSGRGDSAVELLEISSGSPDRSVDLSDDDSLFDGADLQLLEQAPSQVPRQAPAAPGPASAPALAASATTAQGLLRLPRVDVFSPAPRPGPHVHFFLPHSPQPSSESNMASRSNRQAQASRDQLVGVELQGLGGSGSSGRVTRAQAANDDAYPRAARQPAVIDLTGDDGEGDSRNARRRQSQHRDTAPRLNRSDSSYIGGSHDSNGSNANQSNNNSHQQNIIELSSDSEDDVGAGQGAGVAARRSQTHHHHYHHHHHHHAGRQRHVAHHRRAVASRTPTPHEPRVNMPALPVMGARPMQAMHNFFSGGPFRGLLNLGRGSGAHIVDDDIVVLGTNGLNLPPPQVGPHTAVFPHIDLNYGMHPFGNPAAAPAPKPQHEPPPDAREGYTRKTGGDEILICPSCEDELTYDPEAGHDDEGPPAKKPRTKKDLAECHFWAVKACGHVYCKKCYENRRPSNKNRSRASFKRGPDNKKLCCAVDGCDSDVGIKTSWVGIYL